MPRSAFEPLRLRAWLQTPVIADEYLPIDAVLYYHAMREQYGEQTATYSGAEHPDAVTGVQLHLARCNEDKPDWYYAASFARWSEPQAAGQDWWNKRADLSLVDLVDWRGRKARLEIASGPYKGYHMPLFYRHALYVDWYVVGLRGWIEQLLAFTTHLGKKTSQGWGSVLRWEVESQPEDWSVRGPHGELMRAIPSEKGLLTGFRPSYWLAKNQTQCALPGAGNT